MGEIATAEAAAGTAANGERPASHYHNNGLATLADYADARIILEENFQPFSHQLWDLIVDEMRRERWGRQRLRHTTLQLLRGRTYVQPGDTRPRLYFGDFFTTPGGPRLYPRSWYLGLTPTERQTTELYIVPGHGILYAPAGANAPFPHWQPDKQLSPTAASNGAIASSSAIANNTAPAAQPGATDTSPPSEEDRIALELTKKLLAAELHAEETEHELRRQQRQNNRLREERDRLLETIRRQISELETLRTQQEPEPHTE